MNAINCGITDTPNLIFVLPTPPLVERITRRLLDLGFTLQYHAEFVAPSIAEMDVSGDVLVWESATDAAAAYRTAFTDPTCLKMILDWRNCP